MLAEGLCETTVYGNTRIIATAIERKMREPEVDNRFDPPDQFDEMADA